MLISALITFLVVILILYLINLLPLDGRAKQIATSRFSRAFSVSIESKRGSRFLTRFLGEPVSTWPENALAASSSPNKKSPRRVPGLLFAYPRGAISAS
jgi:hypothetical protein